MADEDPKAKRARVARNIEKMASMGASSAEIETYIQSEGIAPAGTARPTTDPATKRPAPPEEDTGGVLSNLGRGLGEGLATAGYSTAKGVVGLRDKLTGQGESDALKSLRESEAEMQAFYHPQGTAGTVGRVAGRILGEGAELAAGSGAVLGGLKAASGVSKLGRAGEVAGEAAKLLHTTRESSYLRKLAANTLPALPLDFAIGAGEAGPGENPLKTGATRAALDAAGAGVLTGVGHLGGKAIDAATDVGKGLLDDAGQVAREPGEELVRAIDTQQAHRVQAALNDPLGAEQVLQRRAAAAAEEARMAAFNARAAQPALIAGVPRPAVEPTIKGRFDALGRPVYDLPGASQAVARGPAPEPVTPVETLTPQPELDPVTLATRRLEAAQGSRVVADGPTRSLLGGPEFMGADDEASRRLATAAAQAREAPPPLPRPAPEGESLSDLIERTNREQATREAEAMAVIGDASTPQRFTSPAESGNRTIVVHRSAQEPGKIQVTRLDENGEPYNHTTHDTPESAAHEIAWEGGEHIPEPSPVITRVPSQAEQASAVLPTEPPAEAVGAAPAGAPATDLFGAPVETEPTQAGLFGERAGTEASRPLASAEASAQNELDRLRQIRAIGGLTPEQAARTAVLEKLVNRGEKITSGELETRALGANPTPSLVSAEAVGRARGSYADWLELNDAAERAAGQAREALARPEAPIARPRTGSGKLKKNLTAVSDEELAHELRVWRDANATENMAPTSLEDTSGGGPQYVGKKRGAAHATGRVVQRQKTIQKIEAELTRRGIDPNEAYRLASERAGTLAPEPGMPRVDESGTLYAPDGTELFSNPVGPALQFGKSLLASHGTLTGAVTGAAAGAYGSEGNEHRIRNTITGAMIGAALGGGAATLLRPRTIATALPPQAGQALDRAAGAIDFDGTVRKAVQDMQQLTPGTPLAKAIGNRFWRAADYIGNAYGVIERLGRQVEGTLAPSANPRDILNYVKSSDHTVGRFYREGVVDPITRQVVGPSYQHIFEPFGDDADAIKKFLGYLKASRDVGRVARMGLDAVGGNQALHATNLAAQQAGDQVPLFRQQAQVFAKFVRGIGDYAEGSGLWTPEQRAAFDASDTFFLPYQRIVKPSIVPRLTGSGGGGLFNVTSGVKGFHGSEAAIDNPALTLAQYTQNIIRRADRYRAGSAIIDAVHELGPEGGAILTPLPNGGPMAAQRAQAEASAEAWKAMGVSTQAGSAVLDAFGTAISKENPVIWRNLPQGGREAYLINSPGLLRAAEAMNPEYLSTWLRLTLSPLRFAKRLFTASTTALNTRFAAATNPLRDAVEAFAKTEANVRPDDMAWGYFEGLRHALGVSPIAKDAVDAGLGGTSMFFREGNPAQMARTSAPLTAADRARNVLGSMGAPVRGLERAGEASDLGPRLAEYMATLRNFQYKVDAGEWTPADLRLRAATNARGVTIDFSNRPGSTVLRAFADYIPFFGVGLQAPVSWAAAIKRSPARALGVLAATGGASALTWALTQRLAPQVRQAIRDRPATERSAFLLVPTDDKGNVARFPLGSELGLVHVGVTSVLDHYMAQDPHAGNVLVEGLIRALPPGVGEWASGNLMVPIPVAQQALEVAKNKTDYGDRPIVPARFQSVAPAERRLDTTAPTFDALSAAVRAVGGHGRLGNFSPLEAEHLTRGVFSNATPLVTSVTDPIAQAVMGRGAAAEPVPRPWYEEPLNPASAVIGRNPPSGTQSENDYYNAREQINFAHGAVLDAKRRNAVAEIPDLKAKYGTLVSPVNRDIVNQADKALRVIKDKETDVQRAFREGRLPGESARDILDRLRGQRQAIYRRASDLFRKTGALQ